MSGPPPGRPPTPSPTPSPWVRDPAPPPAWFLRILAVVGRPFGPYLLAVVFAILAVPVAMIDIEAFDPRVRVDFDTVPLAPNDRSVIVATLGALIPAALIASAVSLPIVRRSWLVGAGAAIVVAWVVGVVLIPVGPTLADLPYATARLCLDGCSIQIVAPGSGVKALAQGFWISPLFAKLTAVTLVVGASCWAWLVRRSQRQPYPRGDG
jgi:hypothetical protein